ncbi:MAG: hypothetical protein U0176_12150 [Bacteroidia bacterium]
MDRVKDPTWNPALAVPLIKSTITVPEVLDRFDDQDIIVVDTTGILALRYFSNIFSVSADSVISFSDQQTSQSYALTVGDVGVLTGSGTVTVPQVNGFVAFDVSNMTPQPEVHSITFKNGNIVLDVTSQFSFPTDVRVQIPSLTVGSSTYDQTLTGVTNGNPGQLTIPLTNAILDLTQGNPAYNQIHVIMDMTIHGGSGSGLPGSSVTVTASLQGMQFATVIGDMKQQQVQQTDGEVRIRFFENDTTGNSSGEIHWADPRVKAIFTNGVGAGVQINITNLNFVSPYNGSNQLSGTTPLLNNPTINFNSLIGGTALSIFDVNRTNSNIVTVADAKPTKLYYGFNALLNPAGGTNINWLKDTSKVRLDMEVFLPFDGTAKDFRRADTTEVDIFPLNEDVEEIESVTFRLTIDNGFPADAHGQVYFYDSTLSANNPGVLIDSLFQPGRATIFASPAVPSSGHVDQSQKVRTTVDITVDRDLLNKLEANGFRKIIARGWIDTYQLGSQNVQIYQDYAMDMWLGLMVKAKYRVRL